MASDENHAPPPPPTAAVFNDDDDIIDADEEPEEDEEDDTDEDDQEEEEDDDAIDDDEEKEPTLEEDLNSNNSATVTVAVPPPPHIPIVDAASILPDIAAILPPIEPIQLAAQAPPPEERKLFQRLWTDEDEIGLLQGFLDYSTQRGTSQNNPHDTALFYDQIKSKLQLDFNKNQLVEKLRRLKKKYRNVLARMSSGKEVSFKSPHDQATFEIACKIWGSAQNSKDHHNPNQIQIDDDMPPPLPNPHHPHSSNFNHSSSNLNLNFGGSSFNGSGVGIGGGGGGYGHQQQQHHGDRVMEERKAAAVVVGQRSRKRSRVKMEEIYNNSSAGQGSGSHPFGAPGMVEEPARSRPLFREMLGNVERFGGRGFGEGNVSPVPLSFASPANLFGMENADDRWRKQQIMELEVYSKRLELVQEHIKLTLDQLRSAGS